MSNINDESLLQEFVVESREHLSSIEPDLLILERDQKNTDSEIINRIFRAIHSIKGASGFFGLNALKSLSHSMENTFMLFRDKKIQPSAEIMDPLLLGVDRLRYMLENIQDSEDIAYQDVVQTLEHLIKHTSSNSSENTPKITESISTKADMQEVQKSSPNLPSLEAAENAVRHGQVLYKMQLSLTRDQHSESQDPLKFQELMDSTGVILSSWLDTTEISDLTNCLTAPICWNILYASVLEPDLLAMTFDLSNKEFQQTTIQDIFSEHESPPNISPSILHSDQTVSQPTEVQQEIAKEIPTSKPNKNTPASDSNETIRVKVELLNRLMDLAGEMVLARNQLMRIFENQSSKSSDMNTIIQNVNLVTSDLQEHIMQTRMQPIASVFSKFPRLVRDLSRQLNKEIVIEVSGEEVELDKTILESLSDPLTHLIRNCCDHAIEAPEIREQLGKLRHGTILLKAYQESGHINIAIIDNGAGIDHEKVAKKALDSGIISEASLRQMTVQEQVNLIFMPGFSTADQVTDVSGRGVGMDVVRTNIEQIGGSINIETEKGKGTTILLCLPLTLAIIPSLMISNAQQIFAVPQINLVELVCVTAAQITNKIEKIGNSSVLRLRGKLLPLIKLSDVLNLSPDYLDSDSQERLPDRRQNIYDERREENPTETIPERRWRPQSDYNILVLKSGNRTYGLIVDEISDIEEIVVKPLSQFIKNCKCFSGATILGDGHVAMILDVAGIMHAANLSFSELQADEQKRLQNNNTNSNAHDDKNQQSILLFTSSENEIFALPISSIQRLEKIQMSAIETIGNHKFLPYQGKSMSLIFLHEHLPVTALPEHLKEAYLIIPNEGHSTVGIIASSILDSMDFHMQLEASLISNTGIDGSAVISNHIVLFINPSRLLKNSGFNIASKGIQNGKPIICNVLTK